MSEGSFVEKFRLIAAEVAGAREYELVHTEVPARSETSDDAYIDKPGGIT